MDSFERKDQPNITLVDQVKSVINDKIARRQFVAGDKLPSIRAIAQKMGVSKSTVVDAYDGLVAQGVIRSRKGAGFYVAGHLPPLSLAHLGPQVTQDIDPLKITRQSLDAQKDYLKPGCGWLPSSWMPEEDIQKTLRSLSRSKLSNLTDYSTCSGLPVLRQLLSRKVADKGIEAGASQILLTESGTQALDLICRFLLEPNDTVLIDDPCYFNFQALLKAHRVNVISTPYTINGPDLDKFKATIIAQKPRLYITNSAIHNPTGAVLSAKVAYQVLKIAEQHDVIIVEDDIFGDLEDIPAPRLAALDGLNRVIHIGSFSKTLSASIRCGYIAARTDWVDEIIDLKLATSFGGGAFSSQLLYSLLNSGSYRKHVSSLQSRLSDARSVVSERLTNIGITPLQGTSSGMFLWCQLPDGLDSVEFARAAFAKNVVLAPGNAFSHAQTSANFMRINVAQSLHASIVPILEDAMIQS